MSAGSHNCSLSKCGLRVCLSEAWNRGSKPEVTGRRKGTWMRSLGGCFEMLTFTLNVMFNPGEPGFIINLVERV